MNLNIRLFIFYVICNYLSYRLVVIVLSSPLQPQSDTKVTPYKKATLMTGGFLLADSMLEVSYE